MRILGFVPLHYGKEYLGYAIGSMVDAVDRVLVVYSEHPSFGYAASMSCPDKRGELMDIAMGAAGKKLHWMDTGIGNESEHRGIAEKYAKQEGFDAIVVTDSDEVWWPEPASLRELVQNTAGFGKRYWGTGMSHLWQGFDSVCLDHFRPMRIINMSAPDGEDFLGGQYVYHFGYAISDELMRYKWDIHGRKAELRPGWMEEKWLARAIEDVHPVVRGLWTPEPFDSFNLPSIMRSHPRWM